MVDRDRTVSRRSEPSSRTALMGEQPNPWDLLQPQDATSRHRTFCPPLPAAQTISSPCSTNRARGRRIADSLISGSKPVLRTASARRPQSLRGHAEALATTLVSSGRSTIHCASADFPRYYPILRCGSDRTQALGSTVISRFEIDISADPPQILRCQTLPSMWTLGKDKPVIPGVPFIR